MSASSNLVEVWVKTEPNWDEETSSDELPPNEPLLTEQVQIKVKTEIIKEESESINEERKLADVIHEPSRSQLCIEIQARQDAGTSGTTNAPGPSASMQIKVETSIIKEEPGWDPADDSSVENDAESSQGRRQDDMNGVRVAASWVGHGSHDEKGKIISLQPPRPEATIGARQQGGRSDHDETSVATEPEESFACRICSKNFTQLRYVKRHEKKHTDGKLYCCGICKKKFTESGSLRRHERTHTGETPYSCGICHKKFSDLGNFRTHERVHTGEKPYSCGICGQKFKQVGHLKGHELIHSGDKLQKKTYGCKLCEKRFSSSHHLKSHVRSHTGEKPFSCEICERKFATKNSLKSHVLTHSGTKPYSCRICDQKFRQVGHRKTHERTHTGEKPHTCDVCNKQFTRSNNLKKHRDAHTEPERGSSEGLLII